MHFQWYDRNASSRISSPAVLSMIPWFPIHHEAAATGPSPPGINLPIVSSRSKFWGKYIPCRCCFRSVEFSRAWCGCPNSHYGILSTLSLTANAGLEQELTIRWHPQEPYLDTISDLFLKKHRDLLTDVVIETEESAAEFWLVLVEERAKRHRVPTLVAFHDDPDLGSDTLVNEFWIRR